MARIEKEQRRAAELLETIEKLMQVCKTEHEMYFMGILRRAPEEKAAELVRQFHELENTTITNTALGFKAKVLRTRHNSLRLIWVRTLKQIEDGTYKRHRIMADVRDKERAASKQKREDPEVVKAEVRALARGLDPEVAKAEARRKLALARGEPDPSLAPPPKAPARPVPVERPVASSTPEPSSDDLFDAVLGTKPPAKAPVRREVVPASVASEDDDDIFNAALGGRPAASAPRLPAVPRSVASEDDDEIFDAALGRPSMGGARPGPPSVRRPPQDSLPTPDRGSSADAIMRTTGSMRAVPASAVRPAAPSRAEGYAPGTDALYEEYQRARRQAGENGGGLSSDTLKSTLARQAEQIKKQYGVKDVRFRVVVEDGKSKVKAIPIK